MHDVFQGQLPSANATGHHRASAAGQCGFSQPGETPLARSVSTASGVDSRWMGHRAESAPGGGEGAVPRTREGNVATLSASSAPRPYTQGSAAVKTVALGFIRFYQTCISPTLPSSCRYFPSCSAYAYEAIDEWGVWRGAELALRRLLRCRPFAEYGYDPVPEKVCNSPSTVKSS